MFITNHVYAGAIIGALCEDRAGSAFVAGFASHIAMDAMPHWGDATMTLHDPRFEQIARRDGVIGLASLIGVAAASPGRRRAVLAGIAGSTILDAEKPCLFFFGVNPFPAWLDRFHHWIQHEAPHRMPHEIAVGAALAALTVPFLRRRVPVATRLRTRRSPRRRAVRAVR